jgi:pseudo-response regulator 1
MYVKSSTVKNNSQGVVNVDDNAAQNLMMGEKHQECSEQVVTDPQIHENGEAGESCSPGDDLPSSNSIPDSLSIERSCTPPASVELPQQRDFKDGKFSQVISHSRNQHQFDVSGLPAQAAFPYCISGVVNQVMMPSAAQLYQKNLQELQNHASKAMMSQYHHLPQCPPHVNGMASFPYYPVNICLQPGQMSTSHSWPSVGSSSSPEVNLNKMDRREAALMKFRQKRKERCFDKKIRYVNRKRLAERRPRIRGQFVRKVNGVNVDLNGQPTSADSDEDDGEDEEKLA